MKFLHYHKHFLWCLKHALQIHYAQMSQALREGEKDAVEWVMLLLIGIHDLLLGPHTIRGHTARLIVLNVFIIIRSIQWHSLAAQLYACVQI